MIVRTRSKLDHITSHQNEYLIMATVIFGTVYHSLNIILKSHIHLQGILFIHTVLDF